MPIWTWPVLVIRVKLEKLHSTFKVDTTERERKRLISRINRHPSMSLHKLDLVHATTSSRNCLHVSTPFSLFCFFFFFRLDRHCYVQVPVDGDWRPYTLMSEMFSQWMCSWYMHVPVRLGMSVVYSAIINLLTELVSARACLAFFILLLFNKIDYVISWTRRNLFYSIGQH